jgi:alpha-1,6-mannosyltransferase
MHIVDSTLFFAPHSGGVKRYLLAKRQYFESIRGVRHTLLVPGAYAADKMPGIVQIGALRIPFAGGYRLPLRARAWRDALIDLQPDLIEVGDPYHLAWAALDAAQVLGVPAVAFAHSHLSRLLASRFGSAVGRATDAYLRRLYARFDAVLAPSRTVAQYLHSIGIERVEIQPLGVDCDVFHPNAGDGIALREQLGLRAQTRLLAFAGRMAREKSIPLMCDAVEKLGAPYHLLLIGAPERRRVSSCVTGLPYQQDARQLASLLASADALLHAGQQETFGLVALEAMACARPVIGVNSGAMAELVDVQVGRLAAQGSVESLQEAIVSLYEVDFDSLGAAARARVETHFAWPQVFATQLARYARLAQIHIADLPLATSHAVP